jgi:hypothetical protein
MSIESSFVDYERGAGNRNRRIIARRLFGG